MTEQLDIFSTGIYCWYCGNDAGRHPNNAHLWNGFFDGDTEQRVCRRCRVHHYGQKAKTEFAGLCSETPIVVETTLLIDGRKQKHTRRE